jgi:hypothetical protein
VSRFKRIVARLLIATVALGGIGYGLAAAKAASDRDNRKMLRDSSWVYPTMLLTASGFNTSSGNQLITVRLLNQADIKGKAVNILGTGFGKISTSRSTPIFFGISAGGQVIFITESRWQVTLTSGPPRVTFTVKSPTKKLYRRPNDRSVRDVYDNSDAGNDCHKMSGQQLYDTFVTGVTLHLNRRAINKVFGGVG